MVGRSLPPGTTRSPQTGIFAMGTGAQVYLELDRRRGASARALVRAIAGLREPRTTLAGVNLVVGFRPELWRRLAPRDAPRAVRGFNRDLRGADGYVMPATQHDAVLWFSGVSLDVLFDEARASIRALARVARVAHETVGWTYRQDRDLTGFVDGTKNPTLTEAPSVALVPARRPGAGGSVLLLQKWRHNVARWEALSTPDQERAMGRTKFDSVELDPQPVDSHVARTDQDVFGTIFRRNVAYGGVTEHGTMFVGFCASQRPLQAMLESMAGVGDGIRDALTNYTRPRTGAYYFVPSIEAIRELAPTDSG
jgi:porphyrinogen peroxidase